MVGCQHCLEKIRVKNAFKIHISFAKFTQKRKTRKKEKRKNEEYEKLEQRSTKKN